MTDQLYHYSIILRTPTPPTKKLQKAHSDDQVFLDKDLKASTYGKHLMIQTMDLGEALIEKAEAIILRRYGPEASMTIAYGWDNSDQNTVDKFEAHKKTVNDLLNDIKADSEKAEAESEHSEDVSPVERKAE
jgi:CRISPR/Cas system-associated exonuclease Cas4 (RecB family)